MRRAIEEVSPRRFAQEPSYTAALLARLEGTPYNEEDGSVVITATNVNSVGRERQSVGPGRISRLRRRSPKAISQ